MINEFGNACIFIDTPWAFIFDLLKKPRLNKKGKCLIILLSVPIFFATGFKIRLTTDNYVFTLYLY